MSIQTFCSGEIHSSDDIQYHQMLYYPKATPYLELGTEGFKPYIGYLGCDYFFPCKLYPNTGYSIRTQDFMVRIKRKRDILPIKTLFSIRTAEGSSILFNEDFRGEITPAHRAVPLRPLAISARNNLNTFIITFTGKSSPFYSGEVVFYDSRNREIASTFHPFIHPISREPARYLNDGAGLRNGDEINTIRIYPSELEFSKAERHLSDIAFVRIFLESEVFILPDNPAIRYIFRSISNVIPVTNEDTQQ